MTNPMLRIGKLTDYAMLILGRMAQEPDSILSSSYLAESQRLSVPTVSKILKMLADAEMVTSVRGAEGGYRLARSSATISVADVIIAMEGGVAMTECSESSSLCSMETSCSMKKNWIKINKMVHKMLDQISITDMLMPASLSALGVTSYDK